MNVLPPDLPESLISDTDLMDKLSQDERVEESLFTGVCYAGENLKSLDVLKCRFVKCDFSDCSMELAGFRDTVFEACDFSNCDFSKASFQRTLFQGCKLMGADFIEGSLRQVRFCDVSGGYVNFADSRVQDTVFEKSRLPNAAFSRCKLAASFDTCDLAQSLFQQTLLKDIDLRTCQLQGIQITLPDLKGAIVTPMQASELAVLLGLIIKERDE
jgi:uncharacterized protein YjbI with pentapeptide repeats